MLFIVVVSNMEDVRFFTCLELYMSLGGSDIWSPSCCNAVFQHSCSVILVTYEMSILIGADEILGENKSGHYLNCPQLQELVFCGQLHIKTQVVILKAALNPDNF